MKFEIFYNKLIHLSEIKPVKKSEGTTEAAMEAEVRAAKERALIPLEQRIKQFKDMLREKDVSFLFYLENNLQNHFKSQEKAIVSFSCSW